MSTLADLAPLVLERLEDPSSIFWMTQQEIYNFLSEALFESMLISGEPEVRQTAPITIVPNQTLQTMPANAIALIRIEGPYVVSKASWWELDKMIPGWRNTAAGQPGAPAPQIKNWFPFGLNQWGVYPQTSVPQNVIATFISIPMQVARPYTGTENVDFQEEYNEGFIDCATHVGRIKEGGQELLQSLANLEAYLTKMEELSKFGLRKGSLRFTRTVGVPAKQTDIELQ